MARRRSGELRRAAGVRRLRRPQHHVRRLQRRARLPAQLREGGDCQCWVTTNGDLQYDAKRTSHSAPPRWRNSFARSTRSVAGGSKRNELRGAGSRSSSWPEPAVADEDADAVTDADADAVVVAVVDVVAGRGLRGGGCSLARSSLAPSSAASRTPSAPASPALVASLFASSTRPAGGAVGASPSRRARGERESCDEPSSLRSGPDTCRRSRRPPRRSPRAARSSDACAPCPRRPGRSTKASRIRDRIRDRSSTARPQSCQSTERSSSNESNGSARTFAAARHAPRRTQRDDSRRNTSSTWSIGSSNQA